MNCIVQDLQNTCIKLRNILIHTLVLHVNPSIGAQTSHPQQRGSQSDRLSLTTLLFEYVVTSLSCGKNSIIYKLHIICKLQLSTSYYLQASNNLSGLLHHHNNPYKEGLQLLLHSISMRFYLILFIHSFSLDLRTYLSIKILCFVGPPSCPLNTGYPQSDVRDCGAHLGHVHPDIARLQILICTFGAHQGAIVNLTLWLLFHPWLACGLTSNARPLLKAPILFQ